MKDSQQTSSENKLPLYNTADPYIYQFIKEVRKDLKQNPTPAEKILWDYLRNGKTGYKIRRQHVIDKYIVDFVCLTKKLVIEVDGMIHLKQIEEDKQRTNDLNDKGFRVIRFTNEDVFRNPIRVFSLIKEFLDKMENA